MDRQTEWTEYWPHTVRGCSAVTRSYNMEQDCIWPKWSLTNKPRDMKKKIWEFKLKVFVTFSTNFAVEELQVASSCPGAPQLFNQWRRCRLITLPLAVDNGAALRGVQVLPRSTPSMTRRVRALISRRQRPTKDSEKNISKWRRELVAIEALLPTPAADC